LESPDQRGYGVSAEAAATHVLWRHPHDLDMVADAEGRGRASGDASGAKGKAQVALGAVVSDL